jgi:calcium-dependent protein kinase
MGAMHHFRFCCITRDPEEGHVATNGANRPPLPNPGCILPNNKGKNPNETYDVDIDAVGTGAFGTVRKATKKGTSMTCAMKVIKISAIPCMDSFVNECAIHTDLDHPNIVRLYETFEDKQQVYLSMELCTGGELFDAIIDLGHFNEGVAAIVMKQIVGALFYMHSSGVVHRDLKPENFLLKEKGAPLDKNSIKVIDFGMAKRFDHKPTTQEGDRPVFKTKAGTAFYVAPEVLSGKYSEKCDVWSCGTILYTILVGFPPFAGESDEDILKEVRRGVIAFNLKEWESVSKDAKELIRRMCKMDPKQRLSAEQVLNSSWIYSHSHSTAGSLSGDLIGKLKAFSSVNRFKKAALNVIAHRVDDLQITKLRDTFIDMDRNGDGQLTLAELKDGCKSAGLTNSEDVNSVFQSLDVDSSGSIGYTEFLAGMIDQKNYLKEELCWEAFRTFDRDGNGTIEIDEFKAMLKDQSLDKRVVGQKDVETLFQDADKNGDGQISFEEFMDMLREQ